MLSHTIGYNDGQDNSDYYARNLLRQSWNAGDIITFSGVIACMLSIAEDSSVSENNTTVVVTKRSGILSSVSIGYVFHYYYYLNFINY